MERNKGIDYLRGLFILLIFISHSSDFQMIGSQSIWGAAGVTGFFMLSGFLYSYAYKKPQDPDEKLGKEIIRNMRNFFRKFYPFYLVMLCVYIFVQPGSCMDFIKCLFLIQSYWGSTETAMSFNGNAWFLSSLMLCYLMSPVLNRLIRDIHGMGIASLLIGAVVIQLLLPIILGKESFNIGYYWVYICPLVRLIDFLEGMLLLNILQTNSIKKLNTNVFDKHMFSWGGAVLLLYLIQLLTANYIPTVLFRYNIAWVLETALLIGFFFLYPNEKIARLPFHNLIVECGQLSFEIFMCHRFILIEVAKIDTGLCAWLLAFGIVIISAFLAHSVSCSIKKASFSHS